MHDERLRGGAWEGRVGGAESIKKASESIESLFVCDVAKSLKNCKQSIGLRVLYAYPIFWCWEEGISTPM